MPIPSCDAARIAALHAQRSQAWKDIDQPGQSELMSSQFQACDELIVAELRKIMRPVCLPNGNQLRLTRDRENYAETTPDGCPPGTYRTERDNRNLMHYYPPEATPIPYTKGSKP